MLALNHILFPTDFSECAEHAFSTASHLADLFGAELHVLHVLKKPGGPNPMAHLEAEAQAEASSTWFTSGSVGHLSIVHAQIEADSAAETILNYIRTEQVDLVVMGAHGHTGITRLLAGSVSEHIMREADCPVLTVHPLDDPEQARQHPRVLAPVDFSEATPPALRHARALADAYGAELHVLHVIHEEALPIVYGLPTSFPRTEQIQARCRQHLEDLFRELHISVDEVAIEVGYPEHHIPQYAETHGITLMVVSTQSMEGLKRFFVGSVAQHVVRHAPCPVFALKPFGKTLLSEAVQAHPTPA